MKTISSNLSLEDFSECSETYSRYTTELQIRIEEESRLALVALAESVLEPIIEHFGREHFEMTYGFCSKSLKKLIEKDPQTGQRNGRIEPSLDQHMAHERNHKGNLYCKRMGAACDFRIQGTSTDLVVDWIISEALPFDRIYYYGHDRPLHISHGPEHSRYICTFSDKGTPTKKGIGHWVEQIKKNYQ